MPEERNYPGNSYTDKVRKRESQTQKRDIQKVAKGQVSTKKKSLGEKFSETFLVADMKSVASDMLFDVIVPAIKNGISDLVQGTVNGLLFGDRRPRGMYRDRGRSRAYTDYSRFSEDRRDPRGEPRRIQAGNRPVVEDLLFETRSDAEEVLAKMIQDIRDGYAVSIGDLYDYAGYKSDNYVIKNKWGWTNLDGASVFNTQGGYLLDLPTPEKFD